LLFTPQFETLSWEKIIRILVFSVFGFILYSAISFWLKFPQPIYILPSFYESFDIHKSLFVEVVIPYFGHWIASTIIGLISAVISQLVAKKKPSFVYQSCWDIFIHNRINQNLIIVALKNGEYYAGILSCTETSVSCNERDIIIEQPAKYNEFKKNYISVGYSYLFLPSSIISSIAVVYDPDKDERLSAVGESLFKY